MGRRYLRANTPARARCPTCGEPLFLLRWGHEERCLEHSERRARKRTAVGVVLLVLSIALMALPLPAHAQTIDPGKVQDGFATAPLATIAFLEAVAIVLLFRELRKETQGRLEDLARSYEAAMKLQESGVKLSIQALEAVEVVERVVERMPARST
jgi:hypothetical protein